MGVPREEITQAALASAEKIGVADGGFGEGVVVGADGEREGEGEKRGDDGWTGIRHCLSYWTFFFF